MVLLLGAARWCCGLLPWAALFVLLRLLLLDAAVLLLKLLLR